MFSAKIALQLLAVIEDELDVNRFTANDVHMWPLARFCLYGKIASTDIDPEKRPSHFKALDSLISARFEKAITASHPDQTPTSSLGKASRNANGTCDILVFSRFADHYISTPRGYYAPTVDPWAELAAGHWACTKAELLGPEYQKTQPRIVPARGHPRPVVPLDSPDHPALIEAIGVGRLLATSITKWLALELGYTYPQFTDDFEKELRRLWADKEALGQLMDSVRPRLVIVPCFYGRPTLGMVWAARERGVAVADIQHGGNGKHHVGYTHWRKVPKEGYHLLPDYFFVWDDISSRNILRWLPTGLQTHKVALAGRFDMDITRRTCVGDQGLSPLHVAAFGSSEVVLITLQPSPSTGITPMMVDAMRKAPDDWAWIIRCHPSAATMPGRGMSPSDVEALLKSHGVTRFECRLATSLPLAAVLPVATHHVTGFSGTAQECAALGIPTTFTHPSAWDVFEDYIVNGAANFVETAEGLIESIGVHSMACTTKMGPVSRDPDLALGVLSQILD